MAGGSSLLIFILVVGMMVALLYLSTTYSTEITFTTEPRLTQDDAIRIADADLSSRLDDYDGIKGIIDNEMARYVPFEEFNRENLGLPLIYVHPNGSLIHITANGYRNMGYCSSGLFAYCGYLPPYSFDTTGKLVYAVEVKTDVDVILFMYIIDAMDGKIVDSTFLRTAAKNPQGIEE
ncbi:MAG: hypothetical protein MN733_28970 [Nitrososphaera sp.]|nr:hypothetical protein [Nitrososphaera sp.]